MVFRLDSDCRMRELFSLSLENSQSRFRVVGQIWLRNELYGTPFYPAASAHSSSSAGQRPRPWEILNRTLCAGTLRREDLWPRLPSPLKSGGGDGSRFPSYERQR